MGSEYVSEALGPVTADDTAGRPSPHRVGGLDGLRGLAALYVVLFHCWLLSFSGFPANHGPAGLGWLMYGRLAVVFFLALSGFSLGLSPAATRWRAGNPVRFLRRRAWRILPPYWAALAMSLVIAWSVVPASHFGPPTRHTVIVYGLMLQDLLIAPTPNGAFWSIAVEFELYLIFPILVLARRRLGAVALLALAFLPLVGFGLLADGATPVEGMNRLAWNLAPVFVAGMVAAGVVTAREDVRRLPWHWWSLLTGVPVLTIMVVNGSVWTVGHYFWIDLAVAPTMVLFIAAVATGRPATVRRLLDAPVMRTLGSFSYSLYLIHLPIIMVVSRRFAIPQVGRGPEAFWVTTAVGVPLSILCAWLFALVFEIPFQRHRSWAALRAAFTRRHRAPR